MSKVDRKLYVLGINRVVSMELPVISFYDKATAQFCLPVASTLVLHPKYHTWATILQWSTTPNARGFAISDGSLQFLNLDRDDETAEFRDDVHASMDPRMVETVRKLRETYPDLAVWEMKSLTVGSAEVMLSIKGFARTGRCFPWDKCTCRGKSHKTDRMDAIKNTRAGPDAPITPWNIPDVEPSESSVTEESDDEKIATTGGDDSTVMASPPPTADLAGTSYSSPLTDISETKTETEKTSVVPKDKGKRREDDAGPSRIPAKRKRDGTYKGPDTITAGDLIQQASSAGKPQDPRR